MTETTSALADARLKLMESWRELHPVYKVLGCVIFAWMAWRTVPIISAILHLVVLAVGLLFVLACIGASEETVALINNYKREVTDYIRAQREADANPETTTVNSEH